MTVTPRLQRRKRTSGRFLHGPVHQVRDFRDDEIILPWPRSPFGTGGLLYGTAGGGTVAEGTVFTLKP